MYKPPFTISTKAINLIAEISAMVERYAIRLEQKDGLLLRRINRIRTIHSSLAIEGNKLSEDEVQDIINGKNIIAPLREIQEVKNAIRAYDLYPTLNPFKMEDLLKAHSVMMEALVEDAGKFRNSAVGVYAGERLIHLAPPATRVPTLMTDLFEWLRNAEDHLLIRSCLFHYEFEFIHPFSDGNGRMGRLWQSLILGKLHPIFEYLPVENMVFANQESYYRAIQNSTAKADCSPFVDFMLQEIFNTLKRYHEQSLEETDVGINVGTNVGIKSKQFNIILSLIKQNPYSTVREMAPFLGRSTRQCERLLAEMKSQGLIKRKVLIKMAIG